MQTDRRPDPLDPIRAWFKANGFTPFPYQEEAWAAYARGESGLISVPTGYGKTLAATMGPVAEALGERPPGLILLYITPLRALTRDLSLSLAKVLADLDSGLDVEVRTGDTSSALKARQLKKPPPILFTTPESLSLMLSYPGARQMFQHLRAVVVDEWHELIAGKRGVQTQLGLARLRRWRPGLRTWGLSATLGNLEEAAQTLVGTGGTARLIRARLPKEIELESIRPPDLDSFPWAGHLGLRLLDQLLETLHRERSTLIFTNTRSQCERWHQALVAALPDFADQIALHHGSMERDEREAIEEGLRTGELKWVVCTSSLDLGVDFQKVEQVVQISSAKSLARLVQRAGRSHHRPGEPSRLIFVPTNSWELIELEAARRALGEGVVEPRRGLNKPFDVLVQHLVTLACGEGFKSDVIDEIRTAAAYATLTDDEFRWCVEFVRSGGATLQAYPQYKKIYCDHHEIYRIRNSMMARQHRMSIGTITGNQQISLHLANQKRVGTIEESFISKLKRGDVFYFSGRKLEFMFMRDVKAYCRPTTKKTASVPSWAGTQFPLSESLSAFFRAEVASERESQAQELLDAQSRISKRPGANELLIEEWDSKEGRHIFIYPFGGRSVHEGLAALWTYRIGQRKKSTFTFSVNDYGLMILGPKKFPFRDLIDASLFETDSLDDQIAATLNLTEMSQRQFRGIAQTAGLVFTGYPTARKTGRQLQVSSGLLFDVFNKHDPGNILLVQARREVLEQQLEIDRLRRTLEQIQALEVTWAHTPRPSPLAVPIWAEMNTARLSTESMAERMARMKEEWSRWT